MYAIGGVNLIGLLSGKFIVFEKFTNVKMEKFALAEASASTSASQLSSGLGSGSAQFRSAWLTLRHSITIDSGVKKFNFFASRKRRR